MTRMLGLADFWPSAAWASSGADSNSTHDQIAFMVRSLSDGPEFGLPSWTTGAVCSSRTAEENNMAENVFDKAAGGGFQIDPPGFLAWLLPDLDPDLGFARWLDTANAPD